MLGAGCDNCPVKKCDTFQYRGSRCAALRAAAGVECDPQTNGERIQRMSDKDLAQFIFAVNHSMKKALSLEEVLEWIHKAAEE